MSTNSKFLRKLFKSISIFHQPVKQTAIRQVSCFHCLPRKSSLARQQPPSISKRHHLPSLNITQHAMPFQNTAVRCCSSHLPQGSRNRDVTLNKDELSLRYGHYHLDLPYVWLRDHCRCEFCYNHQTCQKNIDNFELDLDIRPTDVSFDGTVLSIEWPDKHLTSYNIDWLLENSYHTQHQDRVEKVLWNKAIMSTVMEQPMVAYEEFMETESGLKEHVKNLLKYGFSVVTQAPPSHEGTLAVSQRLTFLQPTLFGPSWSFTSNMAFGDTAYTTLGLGAHTDNTYFMAPSGIQVFHVLEHQGTGGETLLVDGFFAAESLRRDDPTAFKCLSETVVAHEFYDNDHRVRSLGTVLSLHPTTNKVFSLRFNPYDRSPLHTVPPDQIKKFYKSYAALTQEIRKPENEVWVKLKPGMVLFVDNWRVMHGRSAFTGKRRVSGCYLPRDDWVGKARLLGLQNL